MVRRWSPYVVPALMGLVLALAGAQIALIFKVPSWGNDEPAHTGYVAALAGGRLPTIWTDIVDDPARFPGTAEEFRGWDAAHGDIWTANHPPLFHLAMVPVWWLASEHQSAMVITMRLANTAGFAVWLFLVFLVARTLVPQRPAVPALVVVVAAAPTLVLRSAFFQNDGWASASALALLLATITMLRGPVSPALVGLGAAAGTVAAGTRAQGVLTLALCTFALGIVLLRRDGWRTALGVSTVVGGVPALAFGWFYLRNLSLYGDLTGQAALLEKFERSPVSGWSQINHIPGLTEPTLAAIPVIVIALLLVPVALVRRMWARRLRLDAVWALLLVHLLVTVVNVAAFLAAGGGFHDRYLMQVMPLVATVIAVGALDVGRWHRVPVGPEAGPQTQQAQQAREWRVCAGWSAVLLIWLAGALAWLQHHYVYSRQAGSPVDGIVPDLLAVAACVLGACVVAVMARQGSLVRAPGRMSRRRSHPAHLAHEQRGPAGHRRGA